MHCFQSVAPFGVSTRMAGFQKANMITFSPEDFVKYSLQYVSAGDKTNGSICHTVLVRLRVTNIMPKTATKRLTCSFVCMCVCMCVQGWLLQTIPLKILYAEPMMQGLQDYAKQNRMQAGLV